LFRTRDGAYGIVLTGVVATYSPWLLFPERTIFQFYTVLIQPFLLLALVFVIRSAVRSARRDRGTTRGVERVVVVFLGLVLVLAAFWFPLWSAISVPYEFYRLHNWLPGWV